MGIGTAMYAQIVILLIGFSSFVGISIVIPVLPHYATAYGATAFAAVAFGATALYLVFGNALGKETG